MIAAIYARKSTEQNGVGEEAKSVARQIERARAFADRNGWTVADEHIYADDGVSGALFGDKRPGLARLLNALSPRPPFQALVMSEESRLGREQIETSYVLKQLTDAQVRVFLYLDDRERTLDSAMDKVMLSLTNFGSEMEREKASQRTYDAMLRIAKAAHVTGGRTFGYSNLREESHVIRVIDEGEAATVRLIFDWYADGMGMTTIAHDLNAKGVPSPRGRRWKPSAIREILRRELYQGVVIWNKSQKNGSASRLPTYASSPPSYGSASSPDSPARGRSSPAVRRASGSSAARAIRMSRPTCSSVSPAARAAAARWAPSCAATALAAPGIMSRTIPVSITAAPGPACATTAWASGRTYSTPPSSARSRHSSPRPSSMPSSTVPWSASRLAPLRTAPAWWTSTAS
ncbi:MAG: hypothetical protein E6G14_15520 [Actinobacteria bacterium]|nr:MAG: hypothetical protein E6G14_15520 [Actinomycetota bacterium]